MHFFREVYSLHDGEIDSYCGYGMDSITAFFAAVARVTTKGEKLEAVKGTYIDGASQILHCAVIEAGNASIWKTAPSLSATCPRPRAALSPVKRVSFSATLVTAVNH